MIHDITVFRSGPERGGEAEAAARGLPPASAPSARSEPASRSRFTVDVSRSGVHVICTVIHVRLFSVVHTSGRRPAGVPAARRRARGPAPRGRRRQVVRLPSPGPTARHDRPSRGVLADGATADALRARRDAIRRYERVTLSAARAQRPESNGSNRMVKS